MMDLRKSIEFEKETPCALILQKNKNTHKTPQSRYIHMKGLGFAFSSVEISPIEEVSRESSKSGVVWKNRLNLCEDQR